MDVAAAQQQIAYSSYITEDPLGLLRSRPYEEKLELLNRVSPRTSGDELGDGGTVEIDAKPELLLSERRPCATDEGDGEEELVALATCLPRGWCSGER
jgi:hypothetical protein